jgi:hypothetical protein
LFLIASIPPGSKMKQKIDLFLIASIPPGSKMKQKIDLFLIASIPFGDQNNNFHVGMVNPTFMDATTQ